MIQAQEGVLKGGIYCFAHLNRSPGIAQEQNAVAGVIGGIPHAAWGGITQLKGAGNHIAGTNLLYPIDVQANFMGFPVQFKFTVHAHTIIGIVAVSGSGDGCADRGTVNGMGRNQVQLHKTKIPAQANHTAQ